MSTEPGKLKSITNTGTIEATGKSHSNIVVETIMLDVVLTNPWVRAVGALAVLLVMAGGVYLCLPILTSLFFSFLAAYILAPIVDYAVSLRIPRTLAIIVLVTVLLLVAAILPLYLFANVFHEADRLVMETRESISQEGFDNFLDGMPLHDLVVYLGWAPPGVDVNDRAVISEKLGTLIRNNITQFLHTYGTQITETGRSAAQLVSLFSSWLVRLISFLVNLSVFVFVAVYLLLDYDAFIKGLRDLVPPRHRSRLDDIAGKIDLQLRSLLRGQVTVCACLAILYGLGMFLADVPFAFPLALFGGMASIIPYMGPMLLFVPSVTLTLLAYGIDSHLFWLLFVFASVQIVESYLITPRILGSRIGLNPVWIIVSLMVFSRALGTLGIVLAVPITAVLKVVAEEAVKAYRLSGFYTDANLSPSSSSSPDSGDSPS